MSYCSWLASFFYVERATGSTKRAYKHLISEFTNTNLAGHYKVFTVVGVHPVNRARINPRVCLLTARNHPVDGRKAADAFEEKVIAPAHSQIPVASWDMPG